MRPVRAGLDRRLGQRPKQLLFITDGAQSPSDGVEDFGLLTGRLDIGEQTGVDNGYGDLFGHPPQDGDVVFREGVRPLALDGESPDHLVADDQRQGHLGAGKREEWVFEVHLLPAHLRHNAGFLVKDAPANHGFLVHAQPMALGDHLPPGLAGAGPQHGPLAGLVQQEQAGVVQVEPLAGQVHRRLDQRVHVQNGTDGAGDFEHGLEPLPLPFQLGPQPPLNGGCLFCTLIWGRRWHFPLPRHSWSTTPPRCPGARRCAVRRPPRPNW